MRPEGLLLTGLSKGGGTSYVCHHFDPEEEVGHEGRQVDEDVRLHHLGPQP